MRSVCVVCVLLLLAVACIVWVGQARFTPELSTAEPESVGSDLPPAHASPRQLVANPSELTVHRTTGSAEAVTISLLNPTESPIRILGIDKSCECTIPEALKIDELAPGESTDLQLSLHPPQVGQLVSMVRVRTDADAPELEIPITLIGQEAPDLEPYSDVRPIPDRVEFRGFQPGETVTRHITIYANENPGSSPWLVGVVSDDERLACALLPDVKDQRHQDVPDGRVISRVYTARFETQMPHWDDGRVRTKARFITADGTPESQAFVNVEAICEIPVGVAPKTLFISGADLAVGPVRRTIILRSNDGQNVAVVSAACDTAGVGVSISQPTTDGEPVHVVVEVSSVPDTDLDQDLFRTSIHIETTHPLIPTIDVPLHLQRPVATPARLVNDN